MTKDELESTCNRQVNLTYILCGCLENSFNDMNSYLRLLNQDLRFNKKRLLNELISLSKRCRFLVNELQNQSVLKLGDEITYSHDVAIDIIYNMVMKFISITGVDDKYLFRSYMVWFLLNKYKNQIEFPNQESKDSLAWDHVCKKIIDGEISKEEIETLLQIKDEYRLTEDQG